MPLLTASIFTLGVLSSFVFFIIYLICQHLGYFDIRLVILLTLATNFIFWLISPLITDWMQGIFYKTRFLNLSEFSSAHPELFTFVREICETSGIRLPRFLIIEDNNPTAFCYGSHKGNARLAASQGLFKYLTLDEQKAVYAHELGHIANNDFIVMTFASTLVQVLYSVYRNLTRGRSGKKGKGGGAIALIAVISYLLYVAGTYLLLFLSRTRERSADCFSAQVTKNPDSLSRALVKIAYGIAAEADSESSKELLAATRTIGIADHKNCTAVGASFNSACQGENEVMGKDITRILLFDVISPWAKLAELQSTHPLTGKRIQALSECARSMGQATQFDFSKVMAEKGNIDEARLHNGFFLGAALYLLPFIGGVALVVTGYFYPSYLPAGLILFGILLMVKAWFCFPKPSAQPENLTAFELLQDVYASPLVGRYVNLSGEIVGKADAGNYLGEDLLMKDRSGTLLYLNYESIIPVLGNLFFGCGKAQKLAGAEVKTSGWFRRSAGQYLDLDRLVAGGTTVNSYTAAAAYMVGLFFMLLGFWMLVLR